MLTLCIQGFVVSFGLGMVMPIIGVHVHRLGGGFLAVGAAYGIFFVSRLCFTPVVGPLSDLKGRGSFLVAGFLLTSVSGLLLLSAGGVTLLVVARFLQGAAAALVLPVLTACAGATAPSSSVGRCMGTFSGLRSAGLASGFVAGVAFLPFDHASLLVPYLVVIASGLLGLAVLPATPKRATQAAIKVATRYWALLRDPLVKRLAISRAALAMVTPAIVAFLPVLVKAHKLEEPGTNGIELIQGLKSLSLGQFIVLGAIGVSAGALQIGLGWLLDRCGRFLKPAAATVGAVTVAAVLFLLPNLGTFRSLAWVSVLAGLGVGALFLPGLMLLIRAARTRGMGTVVALGEFASGLGAACGSSVCAAVALVSARHLFRVTAFFPLVALVFYVSALDATRGGRTDSGVTTT